MANRISNKKAHKSFKITNGATSALMSVLLLSGSDLAQTTWEKEFVTWLAGHDQNVFGLGVVGFDIDEIAWDPHRFTGQKEFLLKVIDVALQRHRWEILAYDPPYVHTDLISFRDLIEPYTIEMVESGKPWEWLGGQAPEPLSKCLSHGVFVHIGGCLICHDLPLPIGG